MQHKPVIKTLKNSGIEKQTQYQVQPIKYTKKSKESMKNLFPNLNFGKWDDRENQVYIQFMIDHQEDFQIKGNRRRNKVFMQMERAIQTRCADQCRSHHQKVQNFAGSRKVPDLIKFLMTKVKGTEEIRMELKKMEDQKRSTSIDIKKEEIESEQLPKHEIDDSSIVIKVNVKAIPFWYI